MASMVVKKTLEVEEAAKEHPFLFEYTELSKLY